MESRRFLLEDFIGRHVTGRQESLFENDIQNNQERIRDGIANSRVLVIGGAGSIGGAYIKSILAYKPAAVYVVDTSENGLAELVRDLRSTYGQYVPKEFKLYPFSYSDPVFSKMMNAAGPFDTISNFAAHKHVRTEKDVFSIEAMLYNNVINAKALLDYLKSKRIKRFFSVSTDKAANPANVMGASKKLMEEFMMAYAKEIPITTARFANVAFSNGSLLDSFYHRIVKGQPLSAPEDILRYFVSPKESGEICLCANFLGESGDVFFPKLKKEKMKSFGEIGLAYLEHLGYRPRICKSEEEARELAHNRSVKDDWYPIYLFQTSTSGEKTYEEFYTKNEEVELDSFEALGVIKNARASDLASLNTSCAKLKETLDMPAVHKKDVVEVLKSWLDHFDHAESGANLDSKM